MLRELRLDPMRNDGAPSVEFIRARRVAHTRKPHACAVCGGVIPVGSPAVAVSVMTTDCDAPGTQYEHDGKEGLDECRSRIGGF